MNHSHTLFANHHEIETGEIHQHSHTPTPVWAWTLFATTLGLAGWVLDLAVRHPKKH
jgi:hypothetical protein